VGRCIRMVLATFTTYLLGFALTGVGVILGCLAWLVRWKAFIRVGTVVWGRILFWLVGRNPRVTGRENLPAGKSCLVVSNHASMYDIPALMLAVPGIAIMGRDYLTRIPGLGFLLKILHYIPIDTGSAKSAREALQQAAQEIREGTTVGIFAEGTRTTTGKVQPLRRGFVTILRESGADLVPVFIRGTFALQPKGKQNMDPREPIGIAIGTAIPHGELAPLDDGLIMEKVRSILERMGDNLS
jgi:1-acyl-sn-glycerol-3-phosphate acyltransferase